MTHSDRKSCHSLVTRLKERDKDGNTLIPRDFRFGTEQPMRPISVTRDTDFVSTCQCDPGVREATEKP